MIVEELYKYIEKFTRWNHTIQAPDSIDYGVDLLDFDTEGHAIYQSLVNEDGQNRHDAAAGSKPVIVKISTHECKDKKFYDLFLKKNVELRKKSQDNQYNLDKLNLSTNFLNIECFNTTGLKGQFEKKENSEDYTRFFLSFIPEKSGTKLGRRGMGRNTYFLASQVTTFFGLSVQEGNQNEFLRGLSYIGRNFDKENARYNPYAAFSSNDEDQNIGFTKPIIKKEIIDYFKKCSGLKRNKEPGLSVSIPYPIEDISLKKIRQEYIKRFFPSLILGSLKLDIEGEIIDTNNIREICSKEFKFENKYLDFIEEAWLSSTDSGSEIITPTNFKFNNNKKILKKDFDENQIEIIKNKFHKNKILSFKIPVKINFNKEDKKGVYESFFTLALQKKEPDHEQQKAMYMRSFLKIPNESRWFSYSKQAYGFLLAEDKHIVEMLGDSEGKAHLAWDSRHGDLTKNYQGNYKSIFSLIKSSLNDIYSLILERDNKIDFDTFSEFSPEDTNYNGTIEKEIVIEGEDIEDRKKTTKKKTKRKIKIVKKNRKLLLDKKIDYGFSISPTDEIIESDIPLKARVICAYDTRKGNAFRSYNKKIHFDINNKVAKISNKKNIKVLKVSGNEIDFEASNADFYFEVVGFDTEHYDVSVRSRKLKSSK